MSAQGNNLNRSLVTSNAPPQVKSHAGSPYNFVMPSYMNNLPNPNAANNNGQPMMGPPMSGGRPAIGSSQAAMVPPGAIPVRVPSYQGIGSVPYPLATVQATQRPSFLLMGADGAQLAVPMQAVEGKMKIIAVPAGVAPPQGAIPLIAQRPSYTGIPMQRPSYTQLPAHIEAAVRNGQPIPSNSNVNNASTNVNHVNANPVPVRVPSLSSMQVVPVPLPSTVMTTTVTVNNTKQPMLMTTVPVKYTSTVNQPTHPTIVSQPVSINRVVPQQQQQQPVVVASNNNLNVSTSNIMKPVSQSSLSASNGHVNTQAKPVAIPSVRPMSPVPKSKSNNIQSETITHQTISHTVHQQQTTTTHQSSVSVLTTNNNNIAVSSKVETPAPIVSVAPVVTSISSELTASEHTLENRRLENKTDADDLQNTIHRLLADQQLKQKAQQEDEARKIEAAAALKAKAQEETEKRKAQEEAAAEAVAAAAAIAVAAQIEADKKAEVVEESKEVVEETKKVDEQISTDAVEVIEEAVATEVEADATAVVEDSLVSPMESLKVVLASSNESSVFNKTIKALFEKSPSLFSSVEVGKALSLEGSLEVNGLKLDVSRTTEKEIFFLLGDLMLTQTQKPSMTFTSRLLAEQAFADLNAPAPSSTNTNNKKNNKKEAATPRPAASINYNTYNLIKGQYPALDLMVEQMLNC